MKTKISKLTAWIITLAMIVIIIPTYTFAQSAGDLNVEVVSGDGIVTLIWDKVGGNNVSYTVFCSDVDGENYIEYKDEYQYDNGKFNYVIVGLENNKTYTVGVEAVSDSFKYGSMSAMADVTPYSLDATVPSAPVITQVAITEKGIEVCWNAPKNDGGAKITGYEIECWPDGSVDGNGGMTISLDGDVFSYTIDELPDENTSYTVKICAVNSVGRGEYGIWGNMPQITGISFKTDSAAYDAQTNTYTVSPTLPFVVYLTGANLDAIDKSFLDNVHFGFVTNTSENVLGASLSEFEQAGITTVVDGDSKITLTFDYAAITGFLGDDSAFEGIGYGDINSFSEDDIKLVNIIAPKSDLVLNKEFADVHSVKHWAAKNIDYVYSSGLMNGTDDTHFAPDKPLTRAMLVTVLYRLEGEPVVSGITSFADLEEGKYYLDAVCWAQINNITNGVSDTMFAPNDNVTREQIAAIMFRYAQYKNTAPEQAWAIRLEYDDLADISDYAINGVMFCKLEGIMQGESNSLFAPKDNVTRAETAAILERFVKSDK